MTVSTEVDHNEYTGNGVTTSFPYTFRIFKKSDLVVQVSDLNGNVTELVLDTGYKVTGAGTYSGGEVVLPSPLAAGWRITIERVLDVVQETDLRNQGKFFPEVHEDAFDYLTMLIQRCFGWFRRALMKPSLLAKYYDAKQNKISNLADPSLEQDAVNNRSMRKYVDAAIAGVVGGFGWFIQYGAGAVYRTFQDKMRDTVSVKDYAAVGDGITDDTNSFILAPENAYVPPGVYLVDTLKVDVSKMTGEGMILSKTGHLLSLRNNISNTLVQRHLMEAFMGFGESQVFPNGEATSQGCAYANYNGKKLFILQTVVGSAEGSGNFNSKVTSAGDFITGIEYEIVSIGSTDFTTIGAAENNIGVRFTANGPGVGTGTAAALEKRRLVEYSFSDDGSVVQNTTYTAPILNNHQGISTIVIDDDLFIYTQMVTQPTYRGSDGGKGYSKLVWKGSGTSESDVITYQLFGYSGSGHPYQNYNSATPCVSSDGRYVVLVATDSTADDDAWYVFVYSRIHVESLDNSLEARPLYYFRIPHPQRGTDTHVIQDVASDGKYIYILRGYTHPFMLHIIQKFDYSGNILAEFSFEGARSLYGYKNLMDNPKYGTPHSFEPEGIDMYEGDLIILTMDNWDSGASIITYKGKNYSAFSTASGIAPDDPDGFRMWAITNKVSGGEYSNDKKYSDGVYSKRGKQIFLISQSRGVANELPLNSALTTRVNNSPLSSISSAFDVSFKLGENWILGGYSENTSEYKKAIQYASNGAFRVHDSRRESDNNKYWSIRGGYDVTPQIQEVVEFRCRGTVENGAGWNAYGSNDYRLPNRFRMFPGGSFSGTQVLVEIANPANDNPYFAPTGQIGTVNNGTTTAYWNNIYSKNAVTVVSDVNYKDEFSDIPTELIEAVGSVKFQMWKMKDEILRKGSEHARYHFGVVAQQVKDAITKAGLDWKKYGLITYEETSVLVRENESGDFYPIDIESCPIPVNEFGIIKLIEGADEIKEDKHGNLVLTRSIYMMRMDEFEIIRMAYQEKKIADLIS
ncbi:TPA: tail fiber domain-containing protein [Escherichia coli]|nr:tail fiber domain-containing protein [Escherichia coli]